MNLLTLKDFVEAEYAVAIYFSTPNCGVCQALRPKVEALFSERFPLIKFVHIQIDKSPRISGEYGVFSAPTLLVFFQGKESLRKVRLMGIQELQQKIERPYHLLMG